MACLLWSSAFTGIKIGLAYTTPIQFAGLRFMLAGLLVLPLAGNPKETFRQVKSNLRIVLWVALFQTVIQYFFFYLGLARVSGVLSAILIGSGPLFVAILSHFYMPNDRMTTRKAMAIALGFAGMAWVVWGGNAVAPLTASAWIGILFLLVCNLNAGISNILIAKHTHHIKPLALSTSSLFLGGAALWLISIPMEGYSSGPYPAQYYGALLWLSFLSASALSIWIVLLRQPGIKISELNQFKFIIPVAGALLAWAMLPEDKPRWDALGGLFLIGFSLVWMYRRKY